MSAWIMNSSGICSTSDRVIIMVANQIREACRAVDSIARWGGEEFMVTLPETGVTEAGQIGHRIRQSIEHLPQRADEAFYTAKMAGRNTV